MAASARYGALATVARDPPGWPFATLVAVAFDGGGRPILLLSRLAEHTKNLEDCARASLLVTERLSALGSLGSFEGEIAGAASDPLAHGRMTLVGECAKVTVDAEAPRARFLEAHPSAGGYASFADFAVWRMEVAHVRWVGGFGKMEWMSGAAYAREVAGV
jgi:putative heme iron utilization protein